MANADSDVVWMQICYFVEFQKNGEGIWTRKFVDDEENMTAMLVGKSISYDELYKKVVEKLKIDSMLYELEMRCENFIPSIFPELPMKIDSDDLVKFFVTFSDRTKLNITLKKKKLGIKEMDVVKSVASLECLEETQNVPMDDDDDGRDACGIGGKSVELNRLVENHNVPFDEHIEDLFGEKSPREGVSVNDPLLASFGEGVVLNVWEHNNENDSVLDVHTDGSNSHEEPIVKSTGSLDLIQFQPDNQHNNENDVVVDTYTDDSSDDSYFEDDSSDDSNLGDDSLDDSSLGDDSSDDSSLGDDSSDDINFGEDARENLPIGDTLRANNNGPNSHEEPIVKSTGRLDSTSFQPDDHHLCSVRIPPELDICENELFVSKDDLLQKLEMMALKCHFEFKQTTSNTTIYAACCVDEQCGWRVRATKVNIPESSSSANMSNFFLVRIYKGQHSCSLTARQKDHRNASYMFIGRHYAHKFRDVTRIYKPKDIIHDFETEFEYTILYGKAYKAKQFALKLIHGTAHESYEKLPKYCHMLKVQNPGTKTYIRKNKKTNRFLYFFMALGVFIRGFKSSIRRVISVDGTHLKSQFGGTLIVATCQDANLQIYPLAWGIVDSENSKAMTWFFRKLRKITGDTNEVVIISDRGASIKRGFENVFKKARHGYCNSHLQRNLEAKFPRCGISKLFWRASQAYTKKEFDVWYTALCGVKPLVDGVSKVKKYLDKAPFRYWSRAHFDGLRYDIMTTNHAESINSLLLSARELCIVSLIEEIRATMQRWFAERHKKSENWRKDLTLPFELKMVERYNEAAKLKLKVKEVCDPVYEVSKDSRIDVVDLGKKTCSCKKFDIDKFPCVHAVVAARVKSETGYDYCSKYYKTACWKESYSGAVFPLITEREWDFPDSVLNNLVLPPLVDKNPIGRPPLKKRKLSAGEPRGKKCGGCNNDGHDIRTCSSQKRSIMYD